MSATAPAAPGVEPGVSTSGTVSRQSRLLSSIHPPASRESLVAFDTLWMLNNTPSVETNDILSAASAASTSGLHSFAHSAAAYALATAQLPNFSAISHYRNQQQHALSYYTELGAEQPNTPAASASVAAQWLLQQHQRQQQQRQQLLSSTSSDLVAARLAVATAAGLFPTSNATRTSMRTAAHTPLTHSAPITAAATAIESPAPRRHRVSSAFLPDCHHQQKKVKPNVRPSSSKVTGKNHLAKTRENGSQMLERMRNQHGDGTATETTTAVALGGFDNQILRTDKVREALLSKPQRGKKRDDLSQSERVALTRTRNREHAKSTRMRKKARYQELLDTEKHYSQLKLHEELRKERTAVLNRYLALRQSMINNLVLRRRHTANPPDHFSLQSMAKYISMLHEKVVDSEAGLVLHIHDRNFIAEQSLYSCSGGRTSGTETYTLSSPSSISATDRTADSVSQMINWDQFVCDRVVVKLEESQHLDATNSSIDPNTSFAYQVRGGINGVAISPDGTAFGRIDLLYTTERSTKMATEPSTLARSPVLLSGIISATFVGGSSRLSNIVWLTAESESLDLNGEMPEERLISINDKEAADNTKTPYDEEAANALPGANQIRSNNNHQTQDDDPSSSSSSHETLGQQLVHPSVVSLDHEKINASMTSDSPPDDLQQGPGMSI